MKSGRFQYCREKSLLLSSSNYDQYLSAFMIGVHLIDRLEGLIIIDVWVFFCIFSDEIDFFGKEGIFPKSQ